MKQRFVQEDVTVRRISSLEEFAGLKDAWNDLLSRSRADNFFLTWEWLLEWWKAYQGDTWELCILLVSRKQCLIGIAPMYVAELVRKRLFHIRRLMFLGTMEGAVISEYLDFIVTPGEEEAVLQAVLMHVHDHDVCDDLSLQMVETTSRTTSLLRDLAKELKFLHIVNQQREAPYLKLPATYPDFLSSLSPSMRYAVRRNQKKLQRYDGCVFRKTTLPSEFNRDYSELVRLHQCRWESRGMPGSFVGGKFSDFQRVVMQAMLEKGYLELWFLSIGGTNVAALYNIRYKNKIYFFQGGFDVAFAHSLSPGLLLHRHCIEEAIRDRVGEYDFLLMGNIDVYKKRWTKSCRYMQDVYLARSGALKLIMAARERARSLYHTVKPAGA